MALTTEQILTLPTREEVEKAWRSHAHRSHVIDIESNSSIRGNVAYNQEQMNGFTQGMSALLASAGPMVQSGFMPPDVAIELLSATARNYDLGKNAETALDRWADQVRKQRGQPKPPSPEQQKAQAEAQTAMLELQIKQRELDLKRQEAELDARIEAFKAQKEAELREAELLHKVRLEQVKADQEMQIRAAKARDEAGREADFAAHEVATRNAAIAERERMISQRQLAALERKLSREDADAVARKGRPRRVRITRDAAGKMDGAEIDD